MTTTSIQHCDWCSITYEWDGHTDNLPPKWGCVQLYQKLDYGRTMLFDRDLCSACVGRLMDVMEAGEGHA